MDSWHLNDWVEISKWVLEGARGRKLPPRLPRRECKVLGTVVRSDPSNRSQQVPLELRACSWWSCTSEWAPQSERADRSGGPGWQGRMLARRGRCTVQEQICGTEPRNTLKHLSSKHFCWTWASSRVQNCLPEHIRCVIRVQGVGVLTVEELVWLDRRHVQVQGSLGLGGKDGEWECSYSGQKTHQA